MLNKKKIIPIVVLLIFTIAIIFLYAFFTGVDIVNAKNTSLESQSSALIDKSELYELDKQQLINIIFDYDRRLNQLENKVYSNSEMFEIFKDYVTNIVTMVGIIITLVSAVAIFISGLIQEYKSQKTVREALEEKHLRQVIDPKVDEFLKAEKKRMDDTILDFNQKSVNQLNVIINWRKKNGIQ